MLTIEAAMRVTKTKENCDDMPHLERALAWQFDLPGLDDNPRWVTWVTPPDPTRLCLKGYWIKRWLCTDTHVGEMAYFLDDELVFTCEQTARKSNANIYFVDQAAFTKMCTFMDYFRMNADIPAPEFIDDQQTQEVFKFDYAESCIHKVGTYEGRQVEVGHIPYDVRRDLNLPGCDSNMFYALFPYVYVGTGLERKAVHISELTFDLNIDGN